MPLPTGFETLIYRGHFRCSIGFDHSGSLLSAEYGGGLRDDEVIFPKLRIGSLSYPTLHRDAMIEVEEDVFVNRLDYICNFYNASKENGNEPFLMKSPLDGKWFLWIFPEDELSVELIDLYMGTSGLKIKQVYVRGVVPDNADGSFNEEV